MATKNLDVSKTTPLCTENEILRLHHVLSQNDKLRLLLVIALCYVWMIQLGTWIIKVGFRPLLETKLKRQKSYFQLGLDWSQECLTQAIDWRWPFTFYP